MMSTLEINVFSGVNASPQESFKTNRLEHYSHKIVLLKLLTRPINYGGFERHQSITDRFRGNKVSNSLLLQANLILLISILKMFYKVNRGFQFSGGTNLSHVKKCVATHRFLDRNLPKPKPSSQLQACVDHKSIKCCLADITLEHVEQAIFLGLTGSSYNFIEKTSISHSNCCLPCAITQKCQTVLTPEK